MPFLVLILLKMNGWLSLFLAVSSYFGIRFFFHPGRKQVKVVMPDGIPLEEFKKYISRCRLTLSIVRESADAVWKPSFKNIVLRLSDLGDNLVVNFEKDPGNIRIYHALPD